MAKIPAARAGLVFRYRYLRVWQYERGEQVGKERPCCLLLPLTPGEIIRGTPVHDEAEGATSEFHIAQESEVLILLIQSDPPDAFQIGLELNPDDKNYVGLPNNSPSYVIVSEANIDRWPNGDMGLIPGRSSSFTYERPLPGPLLARIVKAFLHVNAMKKLQVLVRQA